MTRIGAVILVALLAACGSSDKGAGGLSGTTSIAISGGAMAATLGDAASVAGSGTCTASTGMGTARLAFAEIRATTTTTCQAEQQGTDPANATLLDLALVRVGVGSIGPAVAIVTGTYPYWDGVSTPSFDLQGVASVMQGAARRNGGAVAGLATCAIASQSKIAGGTVTVTQSSSAGVAGNVDVTLADGERVQGTFSAPACALSVGLDASCNPTGVPSITACR